MSYVLRYIVVETITLHFITLWLITSYNVFLEGDCEE